jgi:hypothetical protein
MSNILHQIAKALELPPWVADTHLMAMIYEGRMDVRDLDKLLDWRLLLSQLKFEHNFKDEVQSLDLEIKAVDEILKRIKL